MNRRSFLKALSAPVVIGGTQFKLSAPAVPQPTVAVDIETTSRLADGWHNVRIVGVELKHSRARATNYFQLALETLAPEPPKRLYAYMHPDAPTQAFELLDRFTSPTLRVHDSIDLSNYVGQTGRVFVRWEKWYGREMMKVSAREKV